MSIRKMTAQDIPAVEHICLATAAPALRRNAEASECTLLQYNRYYTRCCLSDCFVCTDAADRAVGYILCAPDFDAYRAEFRKTECRAIAKRAPTRFLGAYFEPQVQKKYKKLYPAHLHIDILPAYQNNGSGTALMETLKAHLRAKQIAGVFLSVGKKNTGALRFYKRNGFTVLDVLSGAVLMGCRL